MGSGTAYSGGDFDPAVVGNNDIATVFDPFGTAGGYSVAGADDMLNLPGNFDIAAAFGDGFPEATGANYLIEILPTLFSDAIIRPERMLGQQNPRNAIAKT